MDDRSASASRPPPPSPPPLTQDERAAIVRAHFRRKGYRVRSGLQFGCELVLYADDPDRVHSDFCVHVVAGDGRLDWRTLQTLARSMPDLRKTLILARVREVDGGSGDGRDGDGDDGSPRHVVDELAIATEHAPFRHKRAPRGVGMQVKPPPKRSRR